LNKEIIVKYFDEMNTKYGFNDGSSVPPDAEMCREVYCKVLNILLEKNSSAFRIKPFDRPGVHNWCLWIRVEKDKLDSEEETGFGVDNGWEVSIEEAMDMDLDEFVEVEVKICESALSDFLEEICPTA